MATATLPPPSQSRPLVAANRSAAVTPLVDWQSRRFREFFPYSSLIILSPVVSGVVAVVAAALVAGLGNPTCGMAILAIWSGLLMIYLSRPFLNTFLFSPMGYLGIRQFQTFGLGLFFYSLEVPEAATPAMQAMQIDALLGPLGKIIGFLLVFRAYSCLYVPLENRDYERNVLKPVATVGFVGLTFVFISTVILFLFRGGGDRALKSAIFVDEALGWWSVLQLFPGINYMVWFLAPLMWRLSGAVGRSFIVAGAIAIIGSGTLAGGRGALLYPILYAIGGYFSFAKKPRNLDRVLIGFLIFMVPFVTFWGFLRGAAAFRDSRLTDLPSRIRAVGESFKEFRERQANEALEKGTLGSHLLSNLDIYIYQRTPEDIPYAGFSEIANPINAFVPTFIYRDKKQVADGNDIIVAYSNRPATQRGMFLSLNGDLYRRFGHLGVLIGNCVAGAFFAGVMSWLYSYYFRRNAPFGLTVLLFLGTGPSFGILDSTVNEHMLIWLYYIPKHLVFLAIAYMIAQSWTRFSVRGAAAYRPGIGGAT